MKNKREQKPRAYDVRENVTPLIVITIIIIICESVWI